MPSIFPLAPGSSPDYRAGMARYQVNDAAVTRARHKQVELAAHDLLQELDTTAGIE